MKGEEQRGVVRVGGAAEEQSRRNGEQFVAGEVISAVDEEGFYGVRQHGWMCTENGLRLACESAGNSSMAMLWFFLLNSLMSSLPVVQRQILMERKRCRPS